MTDPQRPLFDGRSPETLDLLRRRRSGSAKAMRAPGPSEADLATIFEIGTRVPDHGKLTPWRFLVFREEARSKFGALLAEVTRKKEPEASEVRLDIERGRFLRAPLVVAVISSPKSGKPIPEWEQRLSSAAVCQNMLLAATALGFGAQWVTEWCAYDADIARALGLSGEERVTGFLYFGTRGEALSERERPQVAGLIQEWRAPLG